MKVVMSRISVFIGRGKHRGKVPSIVTDTPAVNMSQCRDTKMVTAWSMCVCVSS